MTFRFPVFISLLSLLGASCSDQKEERVDVAGRPVVIAVNYPLYYFAERISGNLLDLKFEVSPGEDPAFWIPSDNQVAAMQNADLLLLNGASYGEWIDQVSLPVNTRVDTSEGFKGQLIRESNSKAHRHGDGTVHSHGETASLTWLDFGLAAMQATAVSDALIRILPDSRQLLEENTKLLLADLQSLDKELLDVGKSLNGKPLLASHPVYQYLARKYSLNIRSLNWASDTVPGEADLLELDVVREEHPATVMIWEDIPSAESIGILQEDKIDSIVFNPCANRPAQGDWLSVMKENVAALRTCL